MHQPGNLKTIHRWAQLASLGGVMMGLLVPTLAAAPISVANHSFEEPALPPEGFFYSPTAVPGWTSTATGGADRGVWHTSAPGKDGNQIAFIYANNSLAQDLSHAIEPSTTYTVEFLFGRLGATGLPGVVQLYAGGTVSGGNVTGGTLLQSSTVTVDSSEDNNMSAFSFDWTSAAAGLPVGENLSIRLARGTHADTRWVSFDNIRVTLIPEPASAAAPIVGGLMLMRRRPIC